MINLKWFPQPIFVLKTFGYLMLGLFVVAIYVAFIPANVSLTGSVNGVGVLNGNHNVRVKYFDAAFEGKLLKEITIKDVAFTNSQFETNYQTRFFDKPLFAYSEICVDGNDNGACVPLKNSKANPNDVNSCQREYNVNGVMASWSEFLGKKQQSYFDVSCEKVMNPSQYPGSNVAFINGILSEGDFTNDSSLYQNLTVAGDALSISNGNSVVLPKAKNGTDGSNGATGASGVNGFQGQNGISGMDGVNALPGRDGTNGLNGSQGVQGIQGIIGLTGPTSPLTLVGNILGNGVNTVNLSSGLTIGTTNILNQAVTFDKLANCSSQGQILRYYVTDPDGVGPLSTGWNCELPSTFIDTDNQTIAFNNSTNTLSIFGGNSITLPTDLGVTGANVSGSGTTQTLNLVRNGAPTISIALPDQDTLYTAGTGLLQLGNQFNLSNLGNAGTYGSATQVPVFTTDAQGRVTSVTNITITPAASSITGAGNLSAASGKVSIANGIGATLINTSVDINENALSLQNLGGALSTTQQNAILIGNLSGNLTPTQLSNISISSLSGSLSTAQQNAIQLQNLGGALSSSQQNAINFSNLTGTVNLGSQVSGSLPISNGGTGATTVAGVFTNLGLGTLATQNANGVAITGGSIDGTTIGSINPSTGAFTNLSASGNTNLNNLTATGATNLASVTTTGNNNFGGNTTLNTLTATGVSNLNGIINSGTLTQNGASTFAGTVTNNGTLTNNGVVTNNASTIFNAPVTNNSTLTQVGAANFGGGLNSTGPNTLSGGTTINGPLTLDSGALSSLSWIASDGTNIQSVGPTQTLTYGAGASNNLTITVSPTRQVIYDIVSSPSFQNLLVANGITTNNITSIGSANLNNVVATGNTQVNTLTALGSSALNGFSNTGTLTQNGNSNITGNTTQVGNVTNTGNLIQNGNTTTTGATTTNGLVNSGTTNNTGLVTNNGGTTTTGGTTTDTLTVTGNSNFNGLTNAGALTQNGLATLNGGLTSTGPNNLAGATNFTGPVSFSTLPNLPLTSGNVFLGNSSNIATPALLDTSIVPENGNLYFTNARSIGATLTGYLSGAGVITPADSVLSAIQKLDGNNQITNSNLAITNANVTTNAANIAANVANISNLQTNLATTNNNVANNTSAISSLNTGLATTNSNLATTNSNVTTNTNNISANTNSIGNLNTGLAAANTNIAGNTAAITALQGVSHPAVTLGNTNGLSLNIGTQVLSLGLASGSTTGALSDTDFITFNNKQDALNVSNGLSLLGNNLQLGGALTSPTTFGTSATNTFSLTGLQAGLPADSILVQDASGVVKNISPSALLAGSTTNLLSLAGNTLTSTVNGVVATSNAISNNNLTSAGNNLTSNVNGVTTNANIVNSLGNTSTGNTLLTTVNGVAGTGVNIINSNTSALSGTSLINTINGIATTPLDLTPAILAGSTNVLTSTGNVLNSTVNGISQNANIINSGALTTTGNTLSGNVNGVSLGSVPLVNSISNTSAGNNLSTTVNGIAGSNVSIINSNSLVSTGNTLESLVNGISTGTQPIINSNAVSTSGNLLTSTVNGVVSGTTPLINSNTFSLDQNNGFTSTVNGVASTQALPIAGSVGRLIGFDNLGNASQIGVPNLFSQISVGSGLTNDNGTILLGGNLSQDTYIEGNGFSFTVYDSNGINLSSNLLVRLNTPGVSIGNGNNSIAETQGTNQVAIGQDNNLNGTNLFAVGLNNQLQGNNTFVTGINNNFANAIGSNELYINGSNNNFSSSNGAANLFITGSGNDISSSTYSFDNLILGFKNSVQSDNNAYIFGRDNTIKNVPSTFNYILGNNNITVGNNNFAIGQNLSTAQDSTVDIGLSDASKVTIDSTGRLTLRGAFSPNGNDGNAGESLISNGPGTAPYWGTAFSTGNVAVGNGLSNNGSTIQVSSPTCISSQRLSWNGTNFVCTLTTNTLTSAANVLTSTTNGIVATSNIINSNSLSLVGTDLTSTVNGIASVPLNISGLQATANNGLTATSGNVQLGGLLTQNTTINGGAGTNFSLALTNGNLNLDNTNAAGTDGIIKFGGNRFISNRDDDTFVGRDSGNTTKNSSVLPGSNAGFGAAALNRLTFGAANTGIGNFALGSLTTGSSNTGLGRQALSGLIGGSNNIAVGQSAGFTQTTGDKNIAIGYEAYLPNITGSNQLNIGNLIFGSGLSGSVTAPAGNIGIGTSAPTEKLDILGNVRFSGALMPNNLPGTTGQILTSQGAGVAPIWTNNTGLNAVTSLTAIGSTANANGGTIASNALTLQPASATFGGVITTGTQSLSGAKTFVSPATTFDSGTATADTLIIQPSTGAGTAFPGTLTTANLSGAKTWTLPDTTGTIVVGVNGGLTQAGGNIRLGGALQSPTLIGTSATNTLGFTGLLPGANTDTILTQDATGTLRNLSIASILGNTTNNLTSAGNVLTSNVNGVTSTANIINTVGLTLTGTNLNATVNGQNSGTISILNPQYTGANATTAGVQGLVNPAAAGQNSFVYTGAGTWVNPTSLNVINTLASAGNVLTNSTNGVAASANIVNTNTLSLVGSNLISSVNGANSNSLNLNALLTGSTTNNLTSAGNVLTSTTNGVAATSNIINSIGNTSTGNTLLTTANGVAGTGVNIINSNAVSTSGNNLTSTVNGFASATTPIINTNSLTASGSALISSINGVSSTLTPTSGTIAQGLGFDATGNLVKQALTSGTVTSVTGTAGQIAVATGGSTPVISLINTGVTAGTYGTASQIPVFTVDAQGRISAVSNTAINGLTGVSLAPNASILGSQLAANAGILPSQIAANNLTTTTAGLTIGNGTGATLTNATVNYNLASGIGGLTAGTQGTLGGTGSANTYVGADGLTHLLPNVPLSGSPFVQSGTTLPIITETGNASRTGSVAIGTTAAPVEKLDVAGNIRLTSGNAIDKIYSSNTGGLALESQGNNFGTVRLTLQNIGGSNGALFEQVGPSNPQVVDFGFKTATGGQRNLRFETRAGSTFANGGSPEFQFGLAADPTFVVSDTTSFFRKGFVGFGGNAAPIQAVDVTGNIRFSGALMPNNLPGTTGQVLTSQGVGVAPIWTNNIGSNAVTSLAIPSASNANGGSITSNVLTLSLADATNPGLLSSANFTTFNNKENALIFSGNGLFSRTANIISGSTCTTIGQILKWNVTSFACANDVDTTYTAGNGLSLTGTTFANTGVTSVNGSTGALTLAAANSLVGNGTSTPFALSGDVAAPGNSFYYGTNGTGTKGFFALPSANNIYSADGALAGNRTVAEGTNKLTFAGSVGSVIFNDTASSIFVVKNASNALNSIRIGGGGDLQTNGATGSAWNNLGSQDAASGILSLQDQTLTSKFFVANSGTTRIGNGTVASTYGLEVNNPGIGVWTTGSWPKNIKVGSDGSAGTVIFPFNSATQFGIGSTTDGWLRTIRSNAVDNTGTANYDLQISNIGNFALGNTVPSTTATEKVTIASGTAGLSGLKLINLPNTTAGVAGNGKVLGVDSIGNLIYVNDQGGSAVTSLTAPSGSNTNGGSIASNTLTLSIADATNPGLLSSANFTTFNNKENNLTFTGNGLFSRTANTVSGTTCATTGQILKWNGTAFACATDADTTYTAGTGLSLTGTTFANNGLLSIATSTGTTGLTLTPTTTSGAVTQALSGTLATTNGGTGLTTVGTNGQVLTSNGTTLSWTSPTNGVTSLTAVGTTPNANGGTITGSTLTLQPANGTNPGIVSTLAQTFAGDKTFTGAIYGTNIYNGSGTSALPSYAFSAAGNTGFYNAGSGGVGFTSNGTPALTMNSTGLILAGASNNISGSTGLNLTSGSGNITLNPLGSGATGNVIIGSGTASGSSDLLVLDTKNTAGDPTGLAGATYYNSNSQTFRCFTTVWANCDTGSTYTAGTGLTLTGSTLALNNTGITAGTYNNLTIDAQGRATAGSNVAYLTAAGAVTSINGASGALTLAGTNSVTGNGTTTPFGLVGDVLAPGNNFYYGTNATGSKGYYTLPAGGASVLGTIDSLPKTTNGGTISGNTLTLQTADVTNPGLVSTTTQTFAGNKTINNNISVNGNTVLGDASTDTITINGSTNIKDTTFNTLAVANLAAGGNIGTAAATVDQYSSFNLSQSTTGQTITLPNPTVASAGRVAYVNNIGTVSVKFFNQVLAPQSSMMAIWSGTQWTLTGDGTPSGQGGTARKTADTVVNNSVTLVTDPDLKFNVGANETWYFTVTGSVKNANASSIKMIVTPPSAGTNCSYTGSTSYNGAWANSSVCGTPVAVTNFNALAGTGGSDAFVMQGVFTNGATAGTASFQWAQNVATVAATTITKDTQITAYRLSGADLAEVYYAQENGITPGTIVQLAGGASQISKSQGAYSDKILGIASTKPGQVIGENDGTGQAVPVALTGRVPVRVTAKNGDIKPGDYLTSSDVPGVAQLATKSGYTIGKALTAYSGSDEGTVVVFVENGYWQAPITFDLSTILNGPVNTQSGMTAISPAGSSAPPDPSKGLAEIKAVIKDTLLADKLAAVKNTTSYSGFDQKIVDDILKGFTIQQTQINSLTSDKETVNTLTKVTKDLTDRVTKLEDDVVKLKLQFAQKPAADTNSKSKVADTVEPKVILPPTPSQDLDKLIADYFAKNGSLYLPSVGGQVTKLTVDTSLFVKGDIKVDGSLTIGGEILVGDQTAGEVVIPAGQTKIRVVFSPALTGKPIVAVTALESDAKFSVSNKSQTGFDIVLTEVQTKPLSFDWIVVGK